MNKLDNYSSKSKGEALEARKKIKIFILGGISIIESLFIKKEILWGCL
jgi:hypothetical protein